MVQTPLFEPPPDLGLPGGQGAIEWLGMASLPRRIIDSQPAGERVGVGLVEVEDAVVEDQRGGAMVKGGGPGDEVRAHAVAEKGDGRGVDLRLSCAIVQHRGQHGFPVVDEIPRPSRG